MSEDRMTSYFWPKQSILDRLMGSSQEGNKLIMESYFFQVMLIISKKENSEHSVKQTMKNNFLFHSSEHLSGWYFIQSFSGCLVFECNGTFLLVFFFVFVAVWSVFCVSCFKMCQESTPLFSRLLIQKVTVSWIIFCRQKDKSLSHQKLNNQAVIAVTVHFWGG